MVFTESGTYTYNGETVDYKYATTASLSEQAAFVNVVTNIVVTEQGYMPLLGDAALRCMLVQAFTSIGKEPFMDDDGNANIDRFVEFDNETGVSDIIWNSMDMVVRENMLTSIEDNVAYKTGIRKDDISTAIVELVRALTRKIDSLGEGMDMEATTNFINKFNESGFDGEALVTAYMNSEQHKKNVAEVVDAKNEKIRELQQRVNAETAKNVVADKKPVKKATAKSAAKTKKADSESKIEVVNG